jgi:hypothetical protein
MADEHSRPRLQSMDHHFDPLPQATIAFQRIQLPKGVAFDRSLGSQNAISDGIRQKGVYDSKVLLIVHRLRMSRELLNFDCFSDSFEYPGLKFPTSRIGRLPVGLGPSAFHRFIQKNNA